jgi:hypothetical protein
MGLELVFEAVFLYNLLCHLKIVIGYWTFVPMVVSIRDPDRIGKI